MFLLDALDIDLKRVFKERTLFLQQQQQQQQLEKGIVSWLWSPLENNSFLGIIYIYVMINNFCHSYELLNIVNHTFTSNRDSLDPSAPNKMNLLHIMWEPPRIVLIYFYIYIFEVSNLILGFWDCLKLPFLVIMASTTTTTTAAATIMIWYKLLLKFNLTYTIWNNKKYCIVVIIIIIIIEWLIQ